MKRKLLSEIDRDMVISQIKRLDLHKTYTVEITEKKPVRTISQHKLYWLWLTCLSFETGNDKDDLHEYFKEKYIEPTVVTVFGVEQKRRTTTTLTTTQFKYFLDHIQQFASTDLSITLPDPESQYWNEFYKYYVDKL